MALNEKLFSTTSETVGARNTQKDSLIKKSETARNGARVKGVRRKKVKKLQPHKKIKTIK